MKSAYLVEFYYQDQYSREYKLMGVFTSKKKAEKYMTEHNARSYLRLRKVDTNTGCE